MKKLLLLGVTLLALIQANASQVCVYEDGHWYCWGTEG